MNLPRLPLLALLCALIFLPIGRAAESEKLPDGLYAEFTTPRGVSIAELYYTKAPLMCVNFTGLAEGTLAPRNGQPFYTGLTWYRVVPGFVIQSGNPGLKDTDDEEKPIPHRFPDEFVPGLRHDAAGILSMANAGPDTNSCEFFLTLAPTQRLNYLHSVFGKIIRGLEVLPLIKQDDPVSIKILRVGPAAQGFKNDPATFAALSARAKKYTALPGATKEPGPAAYFDDADKVLPTEPPRAKNFNYKLANLERATGRRITARVFAKSPSAQEDDQPGKFMKALAAQTGVGPNGAVVAYFADEKDWRVWLLGDTVTPFFGRTPTAADLGEGAAFHKVKDAFLEAAQAEGDAVFAQQQKAAAPDKQPPPGQRVKLQMDAVLDGLILKLEPKGPPAK